MNLLKNLLILEEKHKKRKKEKGEEKERAKLGFKTLYFDQRPL